MGSPKPYVLDKSDRLRIVQVLESMYAADILLALDQQRGRRRARPSRSGSLPLRFNQLKRAIGPIASRTLSHALKALEGAALIERHDLLDRGQVVEYSLTDMGRALSRALGAVRDWQGQWGRFDRHGVRMR